MTLLICPVDLYAGEASPFMLEHITDIFDVESLSDITGEEVSIDKQVACEECPRWLKMTEVACEKTEVAVC